MWKVIEKLKCTQTRRFTICSYHQIWNQFNSFVLRLDKKPKLWEDRTTLYCASLVENRVKSSTIRSYVSAIRHILKTDGYKWQDNLVLMYILMKACKIVNDCVHHRRPISKNLLEIMLFELERMFFSQPYLEILYKTLFIIGYFGLFRVCELASDSNRDKSDHAVKARNVHVGQNKDKILFVLYTSKTHGRESLPQKIKIQASPLYARRNSHTRYFFPFQLFHKFCKIKLPVLSDSEQLFIFRDGSPVKIHHVRTTLKKCVGRLGLDTSMFDSHFFRIGKSCDLIRAGYSVEEVQRLGCWKSNAVFQYIKN